MVTHYIYEIQLLTDAEFRMCPMFLLYRKLMRKIKKLTCLRSDHTCRHCPLQDQCIYYALSGENFKFYPAIMIKRNLVEQTKYSFRSSFRVELFLLGNKAFKGYIESFFEDLTNIDRNPVTARQNRAATLEPNLLKEKTCRLMTPFKDTDLKGQLHYYMEKYSCHFELSNPSIVKNMRRVYDQARYRLDDTVIRINGVLGDIFFDSLDARLLEIGIGQTNYLGGGSLHALED